MPAVATKRSSGDNSELGALIARVSRTSWLNITYVAAAVGLAIMILATGLMSFVSQRFAFEKSITVTVPPARTGELDDFQDRVIAELKDLTTTAWLSELSRRAQKPPGDYSVSSLSREPESADDYAAVRRNLTFSIRPLLSGDGWQLTIRCLETEEFGPTELNALIAELNRRIEQMATSPKIAVNSPDAALPHWELEFERARLLADRIAKSAHRTTDAAGESPVTSNPPLDGPSLTGQANSFHTASHTKPDSRGTSGESDANRIAESARQLDECLANLQQNLKMNLAANAAKANLSNGATSNETGTDNRLEIVSAPIRVRPLGPLGSRYYLLFVAMLSFGLGTLIALRKRGHRGDCGFADLSEIEKTLGGAVVAVIPDPRGGSATALGRHGGRILKLSEMLILATFVMIVALALLRPEFGRAMLADPLQALCQLIWTLRG